MNGKLYGVILAGLWCALLHAAPTVTERRPACLQSDKVLTLQDSIQLALQNQSLIKTAQAQIQAESGALTQARAGLHPSITATTSTQVAGSTTNRGTQITFSANQLVYDFGRTSAQVRQDKLLLAAGIQNLTGTDSDVVFNVKQAYYTLLENRHLVDVFSRTLTQQQAHVALAQAQEEAGVAPHTTVLTAQAAAASAQVDLVNAQNAVDLARVTLNSAMGIDIRSTIHTTETEEPTVPVPSEDQAVIQAWQHRPEVRRDIDQVLAAKAAVKAASTGTLPALGAVASYSPNVGTTTFGQQSAWAVALDINWTVFNSGATTGAVQQARAQVTIAEETLYTDKQNIASEVAQARFNIIAADAKLQSARVEVASAQANLDAAVGSYQAGIGIFLNVIDAQAALLKAQVDELSALYGLSIARAMLEHATGM